MAAEENSFSLLQGLVQVYAQVRGGSFKVEHTPIYRDFTLALFFVIVEMENRG